LQDKIEYLQLIPEISLPTLKVPLRSIS
jgi:hypothetical protein